MKREFTFVTVVLLLLLLVMSPLTTFAGNSVYPTTTLPSYTTTTTWICDCSSLSSVTLETTTTNTTLREGPSGGHPSNLETTNLTTTGYECSCSSQTTQPETTTSGNLCVTNTTFPPTTTTTLNLTGPDGTAPSVTTPTTEPDDSLCGFSVDLLSTANIVTSDNLSMLGDPFGGYWLCCDCYSYTGETVTILPTNGKGWAMSNLHITVCSNAAFSVKINGIEESPAWFAQTVGSDNDIIAAGTYVVSLDLYELYAALGEISTTIAVNEVEITMYEAGSISIGHLALSDQAICFEPPPNIQTTTIPKFPWNDTTTTNTEPTTNPTVDDVFYPGDIDDDWIITTRDARIILKYTVGNAQLNDRQMFNADFNLDGEVNTADVRDILFMLTL